MKLIRVCIAAVFFVCITIPFFPQDISYTVEKGDTLYSISKKYGVSVGDIRSANSMSGNDLYIGQKLVVPSPKTDKRVTYEGYTVKAGDTLYNIAKRCGITVDELRGINLLGFSAILKVGQKLKIPSKSLASPNNAKADSQGSSPSVSDAAQPQALALIGSENDPRSYAKKTGNPNLIWPVKASEVIYVAGKISGVALTGIKNEQVTAIRSGTVMYSGIYRGFGQVVFVQSPNDLIYVYTGLDTLAVAKGQQVNYGQQLGVIGSDPISGKNLVNLMVFKNGNPIDPAKAPRG